MRFGLLSNAFEYDRAMAAGAQRLGLTYLSAVDLMCNPQEGCLARLGPAADDLAYVDGLHLSAAGARYLAERLLDGSGAEILGQ
jgi:lysophospholipase L1-like esterase